MSYEDRAEKHERLLYRFFQLQRRYAALDSVDPQTHRQRSRLVHEMTVLHLELDRLRRSEGPPLSRPRLAGEPSRPVPTSPSLRTRQTVVRCVLCGFLASHGSWLATEQVGWRVLDVADGKGVCPACIAGDQDDSSGA